jgi:tRNA (guanine37-N1)-methyltransferase
MSLHFNILTLFPDMFPGPLGQSLSGKALENKLWSYSAVNIRDFADDKHKTVDDTPYGGGAGMVMRADVIEKALLSVDDEREKAPPAHPIIYLSPRGTPLTQNLVKEFATAESLTLLCGRYEGVDQRVLDAHDFQEVSIGDYVLSGGEPAALILMDAVIRLLPGVMGNETTPDEESFSNGLLEYPHYTRPATWTDANGVTRSVPDILTSGDHQKVADWRKEQSLELTKQKRPDLLK